MGKIWRYCRLCKKAVIYKPEVFETDESMFKELGIRVEEHQLNLCTDCQHDFGACGGNPEFGDCVGDDNVINCDKYEVKSEGSPDIPRATQAILQA